MPITSAFQDVGLRSPVSNDRVVVFPAPLCPKRANICPLYIVMLTPLTATLSPNFFTKFLIYKHCF